MLILVLSVLTLVSGALTIYAKYRPSKRLEYVFKPLTMFWIILIVVLDDDTVSANYQAFILAGLLASLAGDVFLMLPSDRLMQGLISFLGAHILYSLGFALESDGLAPLWYLTPFALYGAIMLWQLWRFLGPMRLPVIIYVAAILVMASLAANRWITTDAPRSLWALVGAYLFVMSDSVLAVERFRGSFRSAAFWVLSTYFLAQWLIALSV